MLFLVVRTQHVKRMRSSILSMIQSVLKFRFMRAIPHSRLNFFFFFFFRHFFLFASTQKKERKKKRLITDNSYLNYEKWYI